MPTILQGRVSVSENNSIPRAAIAEALRQTGLEMEKSPEKTMESTVPPQEIPRMIGSSRLMRQLRKRIETVAGVTETVLISGENGTGKEIVAKMIHAMSPRKSQPWVTLNCPALSAQLMESELFGHKKGAFTGAEYDRIGRFEAASNGTLLLDEISEIDLSLQSKLLRVLQERSFERVGSCDPFPSSARVLASTNRDLTAEVAHGRFREDLYYRLAVLPIHVPPLRERKEDIPELFDWFLKRASHRIDATPPKWSHEVFEILLQYDWPGNVRQLEHLVTRIAVFGENETLTVDDVRQWLLKTNDTTNRSSPERVRNFPPGGVTAPQQRFCSFPVGMSLAEVEREMIEATLAQCDGHREKTAQVLGIGVRTLQGKLRQYGYKPREKRLEKRG